MFQKENWRPENKRFGARHSYNKGNISSVYSLEALCITGQGIMDCEEEKELPRSHQSQHVYYEAAIKKKPHGGCQVNGRKVAKFLDR